MKPLSQAGQRFGVSCENFVRHPPIAMAVGGGKGVDFPAAAVSLFPAPYIDKPTFAVVYITTSPARHRKAMAPLPCAQAHCHTRSALPLSRQPQ
jgi:hypothetical protein